MKFYKALLILFVVNSDSTGVFSRRLILPVPCKKNIALNPCLFFY